MTTHNKQQAFDNLGLVYFMLLINLLRNIKKLLINLIVFKKY